MALLIALMPVVARAANRGEPLPHDAALLAQLKRLESLTSDGVAVVVPNSVRILQGPTNSVTEHDAVALFTLEGFGGGNAYSQFLALYSRTDDAPRFRKRSRYSLKALERVGARGWRDIDVAAAHFDASEIVLPGKAYEPADPMCCPSRSFITRYAVGETGLIEIPESTASPVVAPDGEPSSRP